MNNIRIAFRSLSKSPAFSAAAILALALGIGANSAIFSVINAIFLRPLPYANPAQIVQLSSAGPNGEAIGFAFSWPRMQAVHDAQHVFSEMSIATPSAFTLTGRGDPELVRAMVVAHNYFPLLGVKPALGRNFLADEDRDGGAPVVLLSYGFWQSHFAGRADALGQPIVLDGTPHTIIGVLPASASAFPLNRPAVFTTNPHAVSFASAEQVDNGGIFYTVLARLAPGVGIEQARTAMAAIAARYATAYPTHADAKTKILVGSLQNDLVGNQRQTFATLFAAVAAVLLIACANVANLVLARFARRRKETGIRFALGAQRRHVVVQFLTESVLLALAGGVLGLGLAWLCLRLLVHVGADFIPRAAEISLDPMVLGFTLAVSILTGLAMGVIPALQASRHALNDALKDSSRESTASRSRTTFRSSLMVGEIALSFVLLIATSLLVASFVRIHDVTPGFRADGVFVGFIAIPPGRYPPRTDVTVNFYSRLYDRLQQIPGAKSVALSDDPPLSGNDGQSPYAAVGRPLPPMSEQPLAIQHLISPNRFGVLDIPIRAGRDFNEHDTPHSPRVVIINETMARQLFPGQNPLGQKLVTGMMQQTAEIIGITADVRTTDLAKAPVAEMFFPVLQRPEDFTGILIRTDGDPATLAGSVRAALHDVDAGIPLTAPGTMQALLDASMANRQLTMTLLAVFAALALVLASLGVYSVMAYTVTQRAGEIGIRMALGARIAQVQKMILGQGMQLALLGLAIGLAAALVLTRLMSALLFEVGASDPLIYLSIIALLLVVAMLACWIPARRAARIDPMKALRDA